ncbi:hypothetical protein MTO96_007717 [Rhipicephalus appendiculatus]
MSESGSDNPARGSRGAAGPLPRAGALPASTLISASAVAHLLTCLVCLEYVLPPFVQCRNGHLMCSRCREQHALCVACESPIDNIRNLAMEHVVSMTLFPCKYSSRGCPALLAYSDKPGHDENCQFTPCRCPCPEGWCTWRGPLRNVLPHIGRSHRGIGTLKGESIVFRVTRIDRPGTFHWVTGQSCFGHHFLVSVKKEEHHGRQQFSAEVQLIGSPRQADKFIYRLKLDGHVRRLGWEAPTRSICEGVEGGHSEQRLPLLR